MPRKKKEIISLTLAVQTAVARAIQEMNDRSITKSHFVFAVKDIDKVKMHILTGIPDQDQTKAIVVQGLKQGYYVVFVLVDIESHKEENLLYIAAFDKKHDQTAYISPCKIESGKIVQVPRVSKKGFQSFLDDD